MEMFQNNATIITPNITLAYSTIGVDIVAICVGLFALIMVVRLNTRLGGKIKSALWFFLCGVFINMFAILWTALIGHEYTIGGIVFEVHDVLMAIGMIFFTFSAYQFSLLVPRE
jgi:uncharacterized membrane protein YczE